MSEAAKNQLGRVPEPTWRAALERVLHSDWTWARNTRCKYVTISIDTRSGHATIMDRDRHQISTDQLEWQYSADTPIPPVALDYPPLPMPAPAVTELERCAAHKDGDCTDTRCPQNRDGEPMKTGRHCPLDTWEDDPDARA